MVSCIETHTFQCFPSWDLGDSKRGKTEVALSEIHRKNTRLIFLWGPEVFPMGSTGKKQSQVERLKKGAEDKMVGWHHQLNGQEFEQTPGDSEGQASLVCCSPWGRKELDMT